MELTIFRGTNQIGGSSLEIKNEDTRILFDFGIPYKEGGKIKFPMELHKESLLLRTDLVGVKYSKAMDLVYIDENLLLGPATLSGYMQEMYSPYVLNRKLNSSEYDAKNLGMMLKKLSIKTITNGNIKLYAGLGLVTEYTESILKCNSVTIKVLLSNYKTLRTRYTHIDAYIDYCNNISDDDKEASKMRILLEELKSYKEKLISEKTYRTMEEIISEIV